MPCCDPKFDLSKMKHKITVQNLTLSPNDSGGQEETWVNFAIVWASVEPKIVKEINFAQRIEPRTDHMIRIRYLDGITSKMRILFKGRVFEIKAIVNVNEEDEFMEILATERSGT